jgi:integrase
LAKDRGEPHVEVDEVIHHLVGRAKNLRAATFYLYKCTVYQVLRDDFDAGTLSVARAEKLTQPFRDLDSSLIGSEVTAKRTSAGRKRHMRPEVHAGLAAAAAANPHPTTQNLAIMIEYAVDLALRPCEFIGAELEYRTLWISAAKVSEANGRGLDKRRSVELLDAFDEADLETLSGLFARLNVELAAVGGDRTKIVRRYAAALRRIRGQVPKAKNVTLYTGRHQARANLARAGYPPADIAALMGHGSGQTNRDHYGRTNRGWAPQWGHKPIDAPARLTARVRVGARAKAKLAREQRDQDESAVVELAL